MGRPKKKEAEETMTEVVLDDIQTEIDLARKELEQTKFQLEEAKKQLSLPKRDIDAAEQKIIDKQIGTISESSATEAKIAAQKAIDDVPVTGRFMNRRAPGNSAKLTYLKYSTDPVKWWVFEDGKVYTIPRGFADQINEYYHTPKFKEKEGVMDPDRPSSSIHEVDTSNKKYAFVAIGF